MTGIATEESITHVVFDWDGTLEDNVAAVHGAGMAIADEFGLHVVDLDYFRANAGRNWREYFDELRRRNGRSSFTEVEIRAFLLAWDREFIRQLANMQLMNDATTALEALTNAGISCSVCSMHDHPRLLERAKRFGLDSYFVRIDGLTRRDTGTSKLQHLDQHLLSLGLKDNASPHTIAMIGDSDDDAQVAARLNLLPLIVTRGQQARETLAELIPDVALFDSLTAAVETVLGRQL